MAFLSQNNNLQDELSIEESIFASEWDFESDIYLQNNGKRLVCYLKLLEL
jgi:hypothetical protein